MKKSEEKQKTRSKSTKFTDFCVAHFIYSNMEVGVTKKANAFAKKLRINYHIVTRVTSKLAKANLIESKRGYATGGITKLSSGSIEDVFNIYNINYSSSEEFKKKILSTLKQISYVGDNCDICEESLGETDFGSTCSLCLSLTEEPVFNKLARCGHPSSDRYFKCRSCQPVLPEEDDELIVGI